MGSAEPEGKLGMDEVAGPPGLGDLEMSGSNFSQVFGSASSPMRVGSEDGRGQSQSAGLKLFKTGDLMPIEEE